MERSAVIVPDNQEGLEMEQLPPPMIAQVEVAPAKSMDAPKTKSHSRWVYFASLVFPFIIFRHPTARDGAETSTKPRRRWISWLLGSDTMKPDHNSTANELLSRAIRFMLLLFGSLFAVFFMVYICFAFSKGSTYPVVGGALYWWISGRNILLIGMIHLLCLRILRPNKNRLAMLHFEMKKVDPDLAYVGVFHTLRRFKAWVLRRQFKLRWFTTFLSDSILLGATYLLYIITCIMRCVTNRDNLSRILSELTNGYKGVLILGFVVYSLEFAPKVSGNKSALHSGIILFIIGMNFADFFLFVGEKSDESAILRAFGSGALLYVTHSTVLLTAILGGHHRHAHVSPDLPLKSVWKFLVWLILSGLFLTYAVLKASYSPPEIDADESNWIPMTYPYVMWGLNVIGGLVCLVLAFRYTYSNKAALQMVRLTDTAATVLNAGVEEHEQPSENQEEPNLDFDITLIVITFAVAGVNYASEVYAFFSVHEYATMAYWFTSPLAPIGLGVLAATFWWRPPIGSQFALYVALILASFYLIGMEVAEDCHMSSPVPTCCEYPWIYDSNHHFEKPHEKPGCLGLIGVESTCLIGATWTDSQGTVIPLSFTAVIDTTPGFIIEVALDGSVVFAQTIHDAGEYLIVETCREEEQTVLIDGEQVVVDPGCFGEFTYLLNGEWGNKCDITKNPTNKCLFRVQTMNCASILSEALDLELLVLSEYTVPIEVQAKLLAETRVTRDSARIESTFYSLFKIMGMAALIECFFTLFGIVVKLIFLSECRTEQIAKRASFAKRRTTVLFDVHEGHLITNAEVVAKDQ